VLANDSIAFLDFFQKFYDNTFFPTIIENNINTVLVLGDTFDRRKYVNFYALDRAKKMFFDKLIQNNIKVYMLAGNHDTYYKNTNDVNSPDLLLREYSNIKVIDAPETITIDEIDICMIPWICPENYQACLDEMETTKAEICMGHFEISGFAMYRGMQSNEGLSKETFEKFDMVFSGHYHHRSDDGHIYYLGNPMNLLGRITETLEDSTCMISVIENSNSSQIHILCLRESSTTIKSESPSTLTPLI
jgi:DNA repair exonuclease SbcCD nuclease subunit